MLLLMYLFSICRYKTDAASGKEREAILEEDDDLWVKIRHKHIADVLEYVHCYMFCYLHNIVC